MGVRTVDLSHVPLFPEALTPGKFIGSQTVQIHNNSACVILTWPHWSFNSSFTCMHHSSKSILLFLLAEPTLTPENLKVSQWAENISNADQFKMVILTWGQACVVFALLAQLQIKYRSKGASTQQIAPSFPCFSPPVVDTALP